MVAQFLPHIPAWPQLPNRSPLEGMVAQFSQGFPGLDSDKHPEILKVKRGGDLEHELERLYQDFLDDNFLNYAVSEEYAEGLHHFLSKTPPNPLFIKGQITGPISFALSLHDDQGQSIAADEIFRDASAKLLRLKAKWQEYTLQRLGHNTIIWVDEPALASYGSAFFPLPPGEERRLLGEVLGAIKGIKGIHCCGNTDWALIMDLDIDVLSFDAYHYGELPRLYAKEAKRFLQKGGAIAWGIVPNNELELAGESSASLLEHLGEAMAQLSDKTIPFRQVVRQGLVTPSCGLASLDKAGAGEALGLLAELSRVMRHRYI